MDPHVKDRIGHIYTFIATFSLMWTRWQINHVFDGFNDSKNEWHKITVVRGLGENMYVRLGLSKNDTINIKAKGDICVFVNVHKTLGLGTTTQNWVS